MKEARAQQKSTKLNLSQGHEGRSFVYGNMATNPGSKDAEVGNDRGNNTKDFDKDQAIELPLDIDQDQRFGSAIANEKLILEIARILKSLGDFNVEITQQERNAEVETRELKRQVSVKDYFSNCLSKVFETLDIVLEWLEQSAKNAKDEMATKREEEIQSRLEGDETDGKNSVDGKQNADEYGKKEGVLRGLYHITEFGSYLSHVGLLELVCKFLDLPENPYKAKRDHIKECLKEVEEQNQKAIEHVEKACDLLQEITNEPQFNHNKADEFNTAVRHANVSITSCKDFLNDAEETMDELLKIMSTMKAFSRFLRLGGFGVTCYTLYHMSPSTSTVDSLATYVPPTAINLLRNLALNPGLKYGGFAAACAFAGYAWLSLFPSKAYAFRDDLEELKLKHKRLTRALQRLEQRLKNMSEEFHEKSKQWSRREDSDQK